MNRSYGTAALGIRAVGSDHFVKLDFSPVYTKITAKRAVGSVHF
ncbi:hypothetical protein [Flavobacterium nackdongense]|nr:hypothetical protein [Flavobacterium nackdongense]